ncbi:hypothetical protein ABZ023_15290 [Streptomyces sp. NPDC006367]|uniref:hypothetical protein n=1 Tax=unclassified Streptomyces TaxID=2593676 RepID=UPI0033A9482B
MKEAVPLTEGRSLNHGENRQPVPQDLVPVERSGKEFLAAGCDELRARHFPVADGEFACPAPRSDGAVESPAGSGAGSVETVVTAHTLVRDLLLQADRLGPDAVRDTGLRSLLPGERARPRATRAAETRAGTVRAALFCGEPA